MPRFKLAPRPKRRRVLALFAACATLALFLDYALYPLGETSAPRFDKGENAVWLSFDWAQGRASETRVHLATRMEAGGVRDLYFHVRYIGKSGRLRFDVHDASRRLNAELRRDDPQLRRFAWVYVGNARGITGVDISQTAVRAHIADECAHLIRDGFDGIHLDYEMCSNGDTEFLALLDAIRARIGKRPLSIATPMWLPSILGAYGWSEDYFAQVGARCDQIAVMSYDSGLYFSRHYAWLVAQQCLRVPRALRQTNCRVLIGVPTYKDGGLSHHVHAENLRVALRAVREGLENNPNASRVDGAAIFADYSTNAREWATWKRDWLR